MLFAEPLKPSIWLGAAVIFAVALAVASMGMLYFLVNPLTAWLTLFGFVGYAFVYSLFLQRALPPICPRSPLIPSPCAPRLPRRMRPR